MIECSELSGTLNGVALGIFGSGNGIMAGNAFQADT